MVEDNSNDDYSDKISKSSKFNGAISQIYRLDELWKNTHLHSRNGELIKWNWDLDRVWCELAGDFNEDSINNTNFETINKSIGDLKTSFIGAKITKEKYANDFYVLLNKKELFLRRLQNTLGKGTEFEDDDDILE